MLLLVLHDTTESQYVVMLINDILHRGVANPELWSVATSSEAKVLGCLLLAGLWARYETYPNLLVVFAFE